MVIFFQFSLQNNFFDAATISICRERFSRHFFNFETRNRCYRLSPNDAEIRFVSSSRYLQKSRNGKLPVNFARYCKQLTTQFQITWNLASNYNKMAMFEKEMRYAVEFIPVS
jgi:hypothetical protein